MKVKKLVLFNGEIATVDDEDYSKILQYSWHMNPDGYVKCIIRGRSVYIHQMLLGNKDGMEIDHVDHDRLNNSKSNLRFVTRSQNMANSLSHKDSVSSKYKGVILNKTSPVQNYQAKIMKDGKRFYLGTFKRQEDAALAYNKAAIRLFGEYACLNKIEGE